MTAREKGFLSYDHPDAIFSGTCTSASTLGGGTLTGDSTTDIDYTSSGWTSTTGLVSILYTFPSALKSFTTYYEIDKRFLAEDYIPNSHQYFCVVQGTDVTQINLRHATGLARLEFAQGGAPAIRYTLDLDQYPDFVKLWMVFDSYGVRGFVEGLPVFAWAWNVSEGSKEFTKFYFGGLGTASNNSFKNYRARNISIIPYSLDLSINSDYSSFNVIGDSQTKEGQYQANSTEALLTGNTTEFYSDTSCAVGNANGLNGMIPVIHGQLNLAGYHPANGRIKWYGRGGARNSPTEANRVYHTLERLLYSGVQQSDADAGTDTKGTHGWGSQRPDVIFDVSGTNDVTNLESVAIWKTEKQAIYDAAIAAGCKRYIYSGIFPVSSDPTYDSTTYSDKRDALRTAAAELAAENTYFVYDATADVLVDAHFQTDNIHLSPFGQYVVGVHLVNSFLSSI